MLKFECELNSVENLICIKFVVDRSQFAQTGPQTAWQYKQSTTCESNTKIPFKAFFWSWTEKSKDSNSVLGKIHTINFIHCRIDPKTLNQKTLDFIKDATYFKEAFYDEVELVCEIQDRGFRHILFSTRKANISSRHDGWETSRWTRWSTWSSARLTSTATSLPTKGTSGTTSSSRLSSGKSKLVATFLILCHLQAFVTV